MNKRSRILTAVIFFLTAAAVAGLSAQEQSPGTVTFEEIDPSETGISIEELKSSDTDTRLTISSNVSASVYIDYRYRGSTPFAIRGLEPGIYRVQLARDGYYRREFTVSLAEGQQKNLYIELRPITGYISFTVTPRNAEIYVDNQRVYGTFTEVPEGYHQVSIRQFGYEEYRVPVQVLRRQTRQVTVDLDKAPFTVSPLSLSRAEFNPANPGLLGSVRIGFTVSAPGSGTVAILDASGFSVREFTLRTFTTWIQDIYWDGRDRNGTILPDGTYMIALSTAGKEDPGIRFERKIEVIIDSSITYRLLSLAAAGGSTGRVPSAYIYPAGTLYTAFGGGPLFAPLADGFIAAPLYFSFSGTPADWFELGIQTGIYAGNSIPVAVNLYAKGGGKVGDFSFAGFLRYRFLTQRVTEEEAGLGMGVTAEWRAGGFSSTLSTEFVFGPEQGILVPFSASWNSGTAVNYQFANMEFGLWVKVYSSDLNTNFSFYDKVYGGLEYKFIIPGTSVILNFQTAAGTGRYDPFVVSGTFGIGILF